MIDLGVAKKIKIKEVSEGAKRQKGFSDGPFSGCLNCPCGQDKKGGACCRYGCDVDKEAYDLIFQNRNLIETTIKRKLEDCFGNNWEKGSFLGGSAVRSLVRKEDGYCIFHKKDARGCWLVDLMIKNGLSRRLIPTICRLYPLTWTDDGVLDIDDEIEMGCDCIREENKTKKSILETQKEEIEDIFDF